MNLPLPMLSDQGLVSVREEAAFDSYSQPKEVPVVAERSLTVVVDGFELVTLMTLGACPEVLVLGYLRNQTLFDYPSEIKSINVDWSQNLATVETSSGLGLKNMDLERRTVTSGCGQGTILSCTLDKLYDHRVAIRPILQSDIYRVIKAMTPYNKAYRAAGSVHGCGFYQDGEVKCFIEDVGRHNALDAIAGRMWLDNLNGASGFIYTTGRLTSEIVMKAALMDIGVLISRNGTTHMGLSLAEELGVMLIARAKSRQFSAFNADHLVFDARPDE